jgi:hypothetical protein
MAPRRREFAPDLVAEARRLYEQTLTPVLDIAAMMGISGTTLNHRINDWGWKRRDYQSNLMRALRADEVAAESVRPPASGPPAETEVPEPTAPADRVAVAARIQTAVERTIDGVERVLRVLGPANQIEAERTARTLANTARTLREIAAFNQSQEMTPPHEADHDPVPQDIDEFREALAKRIEAFVASRRAADGGGVPDDRSGGTLA